MTAEVVPMHGDKRQLPFNLEAEIAVLGSLLVNPQKSWEAVSGFLTPEVFAHEPHGKLYGAIGGLIVKGRQPSPTLLQGVCGAETVAKLAGAATAPINAKEYARLIRDLHLRRRAIAATETALDELYSGDVAEEAQTVRARLESSFFEMFEGQPEGEPVDAGAVARKALDAVDAAIKRGDSGGIKTGLIDFDEATGGLFPGEVTVVAGRPAMGKTALALQIAMHAARKSAATEGMEGAGVAFFSLEMPAEQLLLRDMAPRAGVRVHNVRLGRVGSADFDAMFRAGESMQGVPVWIDDRPGLEIMQIWAAAKALKRRHRIGLIVVDYLQLVEGQGENRTAVVTDVTRKLKAMARALDCHVVALSQLSRGVESRDDKRPHLSDLRESGSIEQDADVVVFLYRDDYYLAKAEPKQRDNEAEGAFIDRLNAYHARLEKCRGLAEIIVAKQRQGPTPTITVRFDADRMTFNNHAASSYAGDR